MELNMMVTNVQISPQSQELLIKAAAEKQKSVEELASEILNEAIQYKFSGKLSIERLPKKYPPNPLANKQPYAYYADPEAAAIPLEDWEMESDTP